MESNIERGRLDEAAEQPQTGSGAPPEPGGIEPVFERLEDIEAENQMVAPWELWESMRQEMGEVQPYVSVVVAARNEEGFITRCLQALAAQDYPRERFEVIVVDGNSSDGTAKEVREMVLAYGVPDIFKTNPQGTTAAGRNIGISTSGGEVIVVVDGHTRVDPSFISASVKALGDSGADAAGGPIRTRGHGVIGRAIAMAMASPFGVGDASFRTLTTDEDAKPLWTDSVPFGAYRRDVFQAIGGYAEDITYGEDDEFNYRLRESGGRIILSPAIRSVYFCRDSLAGLLRQYWNYGQAKAEVLRRHPHRIRPRHLVPSALVLTLAGGSLLSLFSRRFAGLVALAAGSYAIANGIASWRLGRNGNEEEMRYLPAAFAAMHFGAGAGMLAGLWRQVSARIRPGNDQAS